MGVYVTFLVVERHHTKHCEKYNGREHFVEGGCKTYTFESEPIMVLARDQSYAGIVQKSFARSNTDWIIVIRFEEYFSREMSHDDRCIIFFVSNWPYVSYYSAETEDLPRKDGIATFAVTRDVLSTCSTYNLQELTRINTKD